MFPAFLTPGARLHRLGTLGSLHGLAGLRRAIGALARASFLRHEVLVLQGTSPETASVDPPRLPTETGPELTVPGGSPGERPLEGGARPQDEADGSDGRVTGRRIAGATINLSQTSIAQAISPGITLRLR